MKIGLIGYGKMGKAIEQVALERGHEIAFHVTSSTPIEEVNLASCDVAIEFTKPQLAVKHIDACLTAHTPIVVGTTAWQDNLADVEKRVLETKGSLLHASNFSVGVNIFFEINKLLARLISGHSEYTGAMEEIHHLQKLDSPSGTAITLADGILNNNPDYISWVLGEEHKPHTTTGQLGITSYRKPDVPGTHSISYASEIDTITITHEAHNRKGFALGSVLAAEFILGKSGVFTMSDVLKLS